MADRNDGSIAPRRSLSGPILPPPPPEMVEEARKAEEAKAAAEREKEEKKAAREAARAKKAEQKAAQTAQKSAQKSAEKTARKPAKKAAPKQSRTPTESPSQPAAPPEQFSRPSEQRTGHEGAQGAGPAAPLGAPQGSTPGVVPERPEPTPAPRQPAATGTPLGSSVKKAAKPRRSRRARLRLVQVDAWSVMKTSFLLSIALGIVLVVAVAIIWAVLGAAGVWDSINSIVQQAIGGEGEPFDIEEYAGTSRVLGFTMIVAVIDVILITAISTLGAFLYNLSAALLGGIEVTLAEDN